MQKILSINDIKVYSRKEIVAWVEFTKQFTFDQLKNGLFFIKILHKLVPHDVARCKVVDKPINQYEQTQNMNIVKKVLNKHNLQLNMNVPSIIVSKNCFELANWFKNLYEQNKSDTDTEFHYSEKSYTPSKVIQEISSISNYKSLSRATSSDKKPTTTNIKKLGRVTSGFVGIPKPDKFSCTLRIPKKAFDSELTYQLFSNKLSENKNERSRTIKPESRSAKSKSKYQKVNNWFKEVNSHSKIFSEEENIANLMKIQAIEEQILQFQKTIKKVVQYIKQNEEEANLQKIRKEVISIIYKVPLSISIKDNKQNLSQIH